MTQVGIIGATGYTGQELVRILAAHPQVNIAVLTTQSYDGKSFSSLYGNLVGIEETICRDMSVSEAAKLCDVLFIALPHGIASHQITAETLESCLVIDLGADYRIKDIETYRTWYHTEHGSPQLLGSAVYGLCEWFRDAIRASRLIANPGCYTTCSILTLAPLLRAGLIDPASIIVDAKSGVSGAGRAAKTGSLYCEVNESIKAYSVASHRHTPEIEEQLTAIGGTPITISFTPHLVPMNRGILITAYAALRPGVTPAEIDAAYQSAYGQEQFVRLLPQGIMPETRWVKGSNYCDIGYQIDSRTGRIIACGAIDNIVKGASGQAVQNMNIALGFPESQGIDTIPLFPM